MFQYVNIILIFSTIGLIDTTYLLYHTLKRTDVYCLFFPKRWCHKVQHSRYSKTFGVPNSVAGFIMYILLILLSIMHLGGYAPFLWIKTIVTIGFLFSIYFLYIQAFVLRAFCTWCVVSAINFSVMAYAIYLL